MSDADQERAAAKASAALQAAIDRHAGWQLEYDFTTVINDRKRLLARITELEAERARIVDCIRITRDDYPEKSQTWFAVDDVLALIRTIEAERTPTPSEQESPE